MRLFRKAMAVAGIIGMLANSAQAATFYYFRGGATAQTTAQTPPPPNNNGTFAILVDGPAVAARGDSYVATTYTYNNVGSVTYSLLSGALPPGISINPSTGSITGTPTSNGQSQATIQALDAATNGTATATLTLDVVDPFSISGNPAAAIATNAPYSTTFFLAGGSPPYSMSTTALPPGLSLGYTNGASQGTISGSPTTAGGYSITVTGRDANGLSASYPFTLNVSGALSIAGAPPLTGNVGIPYTGSVSASGGSGSGYTYTLAAGSLPAGITLKSATGIISGTPILAGAKTGIRVKVTDTAGATATSAAFSITIAAALPLAISGSPPNTVEEGFTYYTQWSASGGTGPYAFTQTGALPAGLGWDGAGARISGVPDPGTAGSYPVTIKVTDAASHTATTSYTLTVTAPPPPPVLAISGSPSPVAHLEQVYSAQFTATGGTGGYVYAIASGSLPPGISLDPASGALAGVPTAIGNFPNIIVRVTDASNTAVASQPFIITVTDPNPLSIAWTPQTSWTVGDALTAVPAASGGNVSSYVWSYSGVLPPGVTQSATTGTLSGTVTTAGTFGITVTVSDGLRTATTQQATFSITWPPLIIAGSPASSAALGQPYSAQFSATGGDGRYNFALAGNALPPGLTLSSSGLISGLPTTTGSFSNIVVQVADDAGHAAASQAFSIIVTDQNPLWVSWSPQTAWTVGNTFNATPDASGGNVSSYAWSYSGILPPGITQNTSTGALTGSLTAAGSFGPITITVTDGLRSATTRPMTFTVVDNSSPLTVSWSPQTSWLAGDTLVVTPTVSGGNSAAYSWSIQGQLPPIVKLDQASGTLSGKLYTAGTFGPVILTVTDGVQTASTTPATFNVTWPTLTVSSNPSTTAQEGAFYSAQFTATGGTGNYIWTVDPNSLPGGISLNSRTGLLSGNLAQGSAGSYWIAVQVTDTAKNIAYANGFTLTVDGALAITSNANAVAFLATNYGAEFDVSGGTAPYSISATGLPSGLTFQASDVYGTIAGAPMTAGSYPITVTATDSAGAQTSYSYLLLVEQSLTISGNPPREVQVDTAYSAQFTASGGAGGPYVYALASGSLPPGISLDPVSGLISGTPPDSDADGYWGNISVQATDAAGGVAVSATFAINVNPVPLPPLTISGTPNPNLTAGVPYSDYSITASGGASTPLCYAFNLSAGQTLPAGLYLSYNTLTHPGTLGILGTPSLQDTPGTYGPYQVYVRNTCTSGIAYSLPFTLTLSPFNPSGPLAISGTATDGYVNKYYQASFTASGGDGPPYTFSLAANSAPLPPGLSIFSDSPNTVTAEIYGTPTAIGSYSGIILQVTDGTGAHIADTPPFTINITNPPLAINGNPDTSWSLAYPYPYYAGFVATGGTGGPYTFSATTPLPAGLTFDPSTGILTGLFVSAGTYSNIGIEVTDGVTTVAYPPFTIVVQTPLTLTGNPDLSVQKIGRPYQAQFTASGGAPPYAYQIWGSVPPGLSFNSYTGLLSGTFQQSGVYSFQVVVRDSQYASAYAPDEWDNYTITVAGPLVITGAPDPDVYVGEYEASTQPTASGGTGGNTYAVVQGQLPPGLTVHSDGHIYGTPTADGANKTYAGIVIQATDSSGDIARTQPFSMTVNVRSGGNLGIATYPQLPLVVAINQQMPKVSVIAYGGSGNFDYKIVPATKVTENKALQNLVMRASLQTSNPLPPGTTLDSTDNVGSIYGTPDAIGSYSFAIQATDKITGTTVTTPAGSIIVTQVAISLPDADIETGQPYDLSSTTYGGVGPFTYALGGGMLPPGFSIDSDTGHVSGNSSKPGKYVFTLVVTDSIGNTSESSPITIEVELVSQACSTAFTAGYFGPSGVAGGAVRYRPFISNAGWSEASGTSFNGMGFEHVPFNDFVTYFESLATVGSYPAIGVTTSGSSCGDFVNLPIEMVSPIQVFAPALGYATHDQPYTYGAQASASGGKQADGYHYSAFNLPAGMRIDPNSGIVSGTPGPLTAGIYSVTIRVMDSYGYYDTATTSLTVD